MANMAGSALAIEATLPLVEYSLEVADRRAGRWQVLKLTLKERLSKPYHCTLELAEIGVGGDPDALLGASCALEMVRDGVDERRLCGVINRVTYRGLQADREVVSIEVVPALWALSQRVNTLIFQEMSVPDILKEVLEAGLAPFNRAVQFDVRETYGAREYCVQYRESDLAFATRLMQECGIGYCFDHSGDTETLVLFDANDACSDWQTISGRPIPIALDSNELLGIECIEKLTWREQIRSNRVVVRDFDWTQPALDLTRQSQDDDSVEGERELYESNPIVSVTAYDDGSKAYTAEEVQTQAQIAQQAEVVQIRAAIGTSNVIGLVPGVMTEVAGHQRPELDGRYLVAEITHHGVSAEGIVRGTDEIGAHEQYGNRLTLLPADVPYRPARPTKRPSVLGPQTAMVVGPSSEEVYTDVHGRIKVQFHWDRQGKKDERSSCWVRVAQTWAGPGYGTMFIPRIGMEVVVAFLDGNPDRPLVVGVVYNGQNPPPYDLPTDKTKSGIYTRSSPQGTGRNELTFEDAKDSEQIFIHAQKDMNTEVKNDQSTTVKANQTNTVSGDQSESVGGNQSVKVEGNRTVNVTGSQNVTIDGSEESDGVSGASLNITGDYELDASDEIAVQAPTKITLTCGDSSVVIEPSKITLTAGDGSKIVLDANALMESSQGSQTKLDANALMESSQGSQTKLDANALMESSQGSQMKLDANALAQATTGSKVQLDAGATMSGTAEATVTAPKSTLAGAGGSVEAAAAGVTASGSKVDVSGSGAVNIAGAVVKIN